MSILTIIQAIVGLPAALSAIWDKINALEASFAAYQKAQLINSVVDVQKQTEAAQSDADYQKASAANSANLGGV